MDDAWTVSFTKDPDGDPVQSWHCAVCLAPVFAPFSSDFFAGAEEEHKYHQGIPAKLKSIRVEGRRIQKVNVLSSDN